MRKKLLAFFLAACMVLQPVSGAVYAAEASVPAAFAQEEGTGEAVGGKPAESGTQESGTEEKQTEPQQESAAETGAESGETEGEKQTESGTEMPDDGTQPGSQETVTENPESTEESTFESGVETETGTKAESGAETESGTESEAGTERETESGTMTAMETETETETETVEKAPVYHGIDESMESYTWKNLSVQTGSYQAVFNFESENYSSPCYILYTTDPALTFYEDQTFLDRETYNRADQDGYTKEYLDVSFNHNSDKGGYLGSTYVKGLAPETTYYYKILLQRHDYDSGADNYYFLTEKGEFTTGEEKAETGVTLKDVSIDSIGYAGAELSFTVLNPELAEIEKINVVDEEGKSVRSVSPEGGKELVYENQIFQFADVNKAGRYQVQAQVYVKNRELVNVDSAVIEVMPRDRSDFSYMSEWHSSGKDVLFSFTLEDWQTVDSGNIAAKLSFWKNEDSPTTQNCEFYNMGKSCRLENLEEETEYTYTLQFETRNGQLLAGPETGTFSTEKEVVYEDSIFPDAALRTAVKNQISGSDKTFTNTKLGKITGLYLYSSSGSPVENLEGIQYLTALSSLAISGHNITSAAQLEGLRELKSLDLSNNDLTEMPDLSGCTKLETVDLSNNLLPGTEITEEKLPASFLEDHPNWIANTRKNQRKPFAVRTAEEYYATGDTWPFIVAVSGLKKSQNYTLKVTIDGQSRKAEKYIYPGSSEKILIVKGIPVDTAGGSKKSVTYSVTGANGIVYAAPTTVECSFVADAENGTGNYMRSTDTSTWVSISLEKGKADSLGNLQRLEILKDGEAVGATEGSVSSWMQSADNRYSNVFGSYLDTGYTACSISGRIELVRYLPAGSYDIRVAGQNASCVVPAAVTVIDGCVVTHVFIDEGMDRESDTVFIRMEGMNIDPTKVHPVITGLDGGQILEYVGHVDKVVYGNDVIYKYRKVGSVWDSSIVDINAVWSLQVENGYDCLDSSAYHDLYFYSEIAPVLMMHYNYKKGRLEEKISSGIPEGTDVRISLFAEGTDTNGVPIASGSGKVTDRWASVELQDSEGKPYIPVRNSYMSVKTEFSGSFEKVYVVQNKSITWYNYSESNSFVENNSWMNPVWMRTTDTEFLVRAKTKLEKGTPVTLQVYGGDGPIGEPREMTVGNKGIVEGKISNGTRLPEGICTLQLTAEGKPYLTSKVYVYDNNSFYMDDQSGSITGRTVSVRFSSPQLEGENGRKDGINFYNKADYEVKIYDRLGNPMEGIRLDRVYKPGSTEDVQLSLSGVPSAGYTGFYVQIKWKGQLGRMLSKLPDTYYESGAYDCSKYGKWLYVAGESEKAGFMTDSNLGHGIYGVYGTDQEAYPLKVKVYEQSTDRLEKEFSIRTSGSYSFTESDLKGLDEKTVYDIAIVNRNGITEATETGYVICKVDPVAVTGIKLNKTKLALSLEEGSNTEKLEVSYSPANANTGLTLTWTTTDENVAKVTDGTVMAVGAGTAVITAVTSNGKKAACTVQVVDYAISSTSLTLNVGEKEKLQVTDGSKPLTAAWSTSDASVASVDQKGTVEAVGKGSAIITAKLPEGLKLECSVTVNHELESLTIRKTAEVLETGDTDELELVFVPANGADYGEVTWQSSDPLSASVEDGTVTALKAADAVVITASVTTPVTHKTLQAEWTCRIVEKDQAEDIEDDFSIHAIIGADPTLAELAERLPEQWDWVEPQTPLAPYAGVERGDFAVYHENPNTKERRYDTVAVEFTTFKGVKLEGMEEKLLLGGKELECRASYETIGAAPGDREQTLDLHWEWTIAPKAKAGIITISDASEDGSAKLTAAAAGTTTILVQLKSGENGPVLASAGQKITVIDAGKAGAAQAAVQLVDKDDNELPAETITDDGMRYYRIRTGEAVYLKDETPAKSDGSAYKISYKSSDPSVAKPGKADKADRTRTLLTAGRAGQAVITASANDAAKTSCDILIRVEDNTEKGISLSTSSVTINTALKEDYALLTVYNGLQATLAEARIFDKNGMPDAPWQAEVTDGTAGTVKITASEEKSGKAFLKVTVRKDGDGEISAVLPISISVKEKQPSAKSVIVKQIKKVNTLYTAPEYQGQLTVGLAGETITDVKLEGCGYEYSYADKSLKIKENGNPASINGTLLVYLEGYREPVKKAFGVAAEAPKLELNTASGTAYDTIQNGQLRIQVMDKTAKKALDVSSAQVTVTGGTGSYSVKTEGKDIVLTVEQAPARQDALTLTVTDDAFRGSRDFSYKVMPVKTSKIALQTGGKTLTLYDYGTGNESAGTSLTLKGGVVDAALLEKVVITGADAKTKAVLNRTLAVWKDAAAGSLTVKVNGDSPAAGNYKLNLSLKADGLPKELKTSLTVKVVKASDPGKCVKVTQKGTIDVLNRQGTGIILTPKFTNVSADASVENITLSGKDAHLFEVAERAGNAVTVRLKEDAPVVTKTAYGMQAEYTVETCGTTLILSAPVNVKLSQGKMKAAVSGVNVYSTMAKEGRKLSFTVTNSAGKKLEIEEIRLANNTKAFAYDQESGELIRLSGGGTARGKNYSLKFEVYVKDRGNNEKPLTVTWKVKTVK